MRALPVISLLAAMLAPRMASANSSATLTAKVHVPLAAIRDALDRAVPVDDNQLGTWTPHGGWRLRHRAWREPISVGVRGDALQARTRINLAGAVCVEIVKPRLLGGTSCPEVASCGLGEPPAAVDVIVSVKGKWTSSWTIAPDVTVDVRPVAPCLLTPARIDATGFASAQIRSQLEAEVGKLGQLLNAYPAAQRAWSAVKPWPLGPGAWLVWQVERVQAGPLQLLADRIASDVTIAVGAQVVSSAAAPAIPPLPAAMAVGAPGPSGGWSLALAASWQDVEAAAVAAVGSFSVGDLQAQLRRVSASGSRVHLELDLKGLVTTRVSLSGRLVYDAASDELSAADLQLDGPPPAVGQLLVASLAPRLRIRLNPLIAARLKSVDDALTSRGIAHPAPAGVRVQRVEVTPEALSVAVSMPGSLALAP